MQVQRFRKPTVREALADVRQALGPEALVVRTAMVPVRGWRRWTGAREVEVTAAMASPVSETRPVAPALLLPADPLDSGADAVARLEAVGLDRGLATEVVAGLPPRQRRSPSAALLRGALAARLGGLTAADEPLAPIEVFVGPPGVGKTTTIAKLAARSRARGLRVALASADGFRVGAIEQLRLYAEILGAPFFAARAADDLASALDAAPRPLLVDTAGRSPHDDAAREQFEALTGRPGVRTHLVIAATTSPRGAERVLAQFRAARPDRVVLTKLDEAETVAPLVRVLRAAGLPVSWAGTGQRVPEDLARATADLLAATLLGDSTGRWGDA